MLTTNTGGPTEGSTRLASSEKSLETHPDVTGAIGCGGVAGAKAVAKG